MNTEITDHEERRGLVFYDAECRLCVALARRCARPLAGRGFALVPLQTPWVSRRLGLTEAQLLVEMRLLLPNGTILGGADAVLEICRQFWWARPVHWIGRLPALTSLVRRAYAWIARHRHCGDAACRILEPEASEGRVTRVPKLPEVGLAKLVLPRFRSSMREASVRRNLFPLLLFPALALLFARPLEAWVFMWVMAFALYAGCKWMTYSAAKRSGARTNWWRAPGYLLAWPGMDATAFLHPESRSPKPQLGEWLFAATKTIVGVLLVWLVARRLASVGSLQAGWAGMIGLVLVLHFGSFHLLSLGWRSAGIRAVPLMRSPLLARSLSEFWGRRWNTAFHELAHRFTFRPLRRVAGPVGATLLVFLLSGLLHELVISLPARGGYGLPTGYFLIQGLGVIGERTPLGRRLGLGHGRRGRLFTLIVAAGPAFWLFHPPFVHNVILPMLSAIGAT